MPELPLVTYLQSLGERRLSEIPLGIHSGKGSAITGTFFAFRARDHHVWRFYPAGGSEPISDKRRICQMIQCGENEPRVVPEHNIFPVLEQDVIEPSVLEHLKREDLELICYEILGDVGSSQQHVEKA